LNTASNAKFLYFATHHIASALAMSNVPNLIFSHENLNKDCISRRTFYRAASKLSLSSSHSSRWGDIDKSTVSEDESATPVETTPRKPKLSVKEAIYELMLWDKVVAKGRSILKKSLKPRGIQPPPGVSVQVAFYTFTGVFLTLFVIGVFNQQVEKLSDDDFFVTIGPIGALLTLQFALSATPAAQPRNSLYGTAMSLPISIILKRIFVHNVGISQWIVASLSTALSITLMQFTGFIHPPAGAAALVFAWRDTHISDDWMLFLVFMVADIICISMAVLINNFNDSRQYPIYWKLASL